MERLGRWPAPAMVGAAGVALLLAASGCAPQASEAKVDNGPGAAAPATTGGFQATIYETQLAPAQAGKVDPGALAAHAADANALGQALEQLGKTKVLYRVFQNLSLGSETKITLGERKPMVMARRMSETGRQINTVRYEQIGAMFTVLAEPPKDPRARHADVEMSAELSVPVDSGVELAKGVPARAVRSVALTYKGTVALGRPFVMVSVDSSAPGKDAAAIAYVCRVILTADTR